MKNIKSKAHSIKPAIRIGKQGLTEQVINEIKLQLKKKKLIKIKLLKASLEKKNKKQLRDEILEKTNANLVSHVGFVITLRKS